jgi:hypothetical protein
MSKMSRSCARVLFTLVCVFVALSQDSYAAVLYRTAGTVTEADADTLASVGDRVFGLVILSDEALEKSPPDEFALGNGDVLAIFIQFGSYFWNFARPSVDFVQFEGWLNEGGDSIGQHFFRLIENFSGTISDRYCLPNQVCEISGGIGYMTQYDGRGWAYAQMTSWARVPEPGTLVLLATSLVGFAFARRRQQ